MEIQEKHFIVGIDLGTTNSAVSYVDLRQSPTGRSAIQIFEVPQLIAAGEVAPLPILPSFAYIPGDYDIAKEAIAVPWPTAGNHVVGAFARDHGASVPSRLVSSAKSWLCHGGVDRRAKILPWGAGDEVRKVSPIEATSFYLAHIRSTWNTCWQDEESALENQLVVLTVPASFDEVARDLTVEAARMAGLAQITLIEEPLAAFYSWLTRHENDWDRFVKPGELILVCDVGGGTTDFTLISLQAAEGGPRFERIAVGDHLILGGDNMDLALARHIEATLGRQRVSLTGDRWRSLCHQCRQAKEALLGGTDGPRRITIIGKGSRLIAETMTCELDRHTVEETVLEGFFPRVGPQKSQTQTAPRGIAEFGLPYEPDPAITRHLGRFLDRHREEISAIKQRPGHAPDLILFNGGALKPLAVQEKICTAVDAWFGEEAAARPRVLENPSPELAVAVGAAYYGLVKTGHGVRIGSGSARSYYLGISLKQGAGGGTEPKRAICLVERGLVEGSRIQSLDGNFEVLTNQPVSFDIYSSSFRSGDRAGNIVIVDDSLTALPPIQTVVEFGKRGLKAAIPVQLEAEFTEIGTLALWCRSTTTPHRWQLQFQLREAAVAMDVTDATIQEDSTVQHVLDILADGFAAPVDSRRLNALAKDISGAIGKKRDQWPLALIRAMGDRLLEMADARRLGPDHEIRWLNLVGFCLRPGFGDSFDPQRMRHLMKIYPQGPIFSKNPQVRSEWYIMWRRIAGGLKAGQQRQFIQDLTPRFFPKTGAGEKIAPQEKLETLMAVANMEQLAVSDKVRWGRLLLTELHPKKSKPQHLWSLSRLGARALFYGPANRVVPPQTVSQWVDDLLSRQWANPRPVAAALAQLARRTGDRMRDLEPDRIDRIVNWLTAVGPFNEHIRMLEQIVPIARREETTIFGDSLPAGLVLHAD